MYRPSVLAQAGFQHVLPHVCVCACVWDSVSADTITDPAHDTYHKGNVALRKGWQQLLLPTTFQCICACLECACAECACGECACGDVLVQM